MISADVLHTTGSSAYCYSHIGKILECLKQAIVLPVGEGGSPSILSEANPGGPQTVRVVFMSLENKLSKGSEL